MSHFNLWKGAGSRLLAPYTDLAVNYGPGGGEEEGRGGESGGGGRGGEMMGGKKRKKCRADLSLQQIKP